MQNESRIALTPRGSAADGGRADGGRSSRNARRASAAVDRRIGKARRRLARGLPITDRQRRLLRRFG